MIKKGMKLIYAILMCLIIVNTVSISNTKVFARKDQVTIVDGGGGGSSGQSETTDFLGDLNDWKPTLSSEDADFTKKVNIIVTAVRTIGIMISVITLSIIGIKFMIGSVEDRAQYKQTLIPWIIGAILVVAITTIPTLLYEIAKG